MERVGVLDGQGETLGADRAEGTAAETGCLVLMMWAPPAPPANEESSGMAGIS